MTEAKLQSQLKLENEAVLLSSDALLGQLRIDPDTLQLE